MLYLEPLTDTQISPIDTTFIIDNSLFDLSELCKNMNSYIKHIIHTRIKLQPVFTITQVNYIGKYIVNTKS